MNTDMEKHSKAPWSATLQGDLLDADGVLIAQLFDNPDNGLEPLGEETSDFNSALLVHAPELLAALKAVIHRVKEWDPRIEESGTDLGSVIVEAQKTIERATGAEMQRSSPNAPCGAST